MISWWLLPLFAGLGVAAPAGPLRQFSGLASVSIFGDTLAHGALLGITLGILFDLHLPSR